MGAHLECNHVSFMHLDSVLSTLRFACQPQPGSQAPDPGAVDVPAPVPEPARRCVTFIHAVRPTSAGSSNNNPSCSSIACMARGIVRWLGEASESRSGPPAE